jgi:asparagine synthase (glutamine-hydrolysing)
MRPRGPDSVGYWSESGTSLGLRRLAIIDLDPRANQPMTSDDGKYVIVFNGEIYNYRALRADLEKRGERFRTGSDTEVLVRLFQREGPAMLGRLRGMYALAIWDTAERSAFVARDPYGIKPLYFASTPLGVIFASQVRALLDTGLPSREPDAVGQAGFWMTGSVPEPHTWFRDIHALPAGSYAVIAPDRSIRMRVFADLAPYWHSPADARSDDEVAECVRTALRDSVSAHLVSDVPVAVFLSGGIDSGSVAGLMIDAGATDLPGVTLAFDEFAGRPEDEVPAAREVASRYGVQHTVRKVTRQEFEEELPRIFDAMDQPTVDGINTWYASKAIAERGFKVVVSGIGGDELFQGYSTFNTLPAAVPVWKHASRFPGFLPLSAVVLSAYGRSAANPRWNLVPELLSSMEGAWFLRRGLFSPAELDGLMGAELAAEALNRFHPVAMVQEMTGPLPGDARLKLSQIESMAYLRNQLLRDSDWASMAHSVELRTPLVDVELLRTLSPLLGAFRRFPRKSLLAHAPARPLPKSVIARRKTGFGVPIQKWLSEMGLASERDGMSRGWARALARHVYAG